MSMDLEAKIKAALKEIDSFRTPDCLDDNTIGRYAENTLAEPQRQAADAHLHSCLYCLKQLNDMTELLHFQKKQVPLSPRLEARLKEMLPEPENVLPRGIHPTPIIQRLKELVTFTPQMWRFSAIGLAAAWVIFIVSSLVVRQTGHEGGFPALNRNAFVKVQALNNTGGVLTEQQGVVVGSDGLIASNLAPLAGASRLRITLADGTTRDISQIWKDDDKNLAVMKTGVNGLASLPLSDIKDIVGRKIYAVADFAVSGIKISEAVASDIRELPSRRKGGGDKFIQVATQGSAASKGAIVDERGNLLGFLITEEKHINLATPAQDVAQLVKIGKAIPISELKNVSFSADAINFYMKGILARDGQRWDEAIGYLQKAVKLNPRLEGAYVELGYAFYRKLDFEREAEAYKAVLKINPDNVDALYSLAWTLESHGKYPEAISYYEKALSVDPKDIETLYQLGISYLAQGNRAKATEMYGRLKKLDPGNAEMLRRLIR